MKKKGNTDMWLVEVTTDKLAAGREELRGAIAEVVKTAIKNRWVDAGKAKRWLEKLEKGRVLMEGWPKYEVRLTSSGALEVKFGSTNRNSIEQVAQWLEKRGLKRGVHFTVEMPKDGKKGYVYIRRKGLAYAAWLSVHGEGEQRRLAEEFVKLILKRAEEAGDAVYKKAEEIIEKGKVWRSLTLKGFEKEFEVDSKKYKVKVIDGEAVEEDRNGKTLLRIRITADVNGVRSEYVITYSRRGSNNAAVGYAYASIYAPGGREADADRLSALIKALTGKEPRIRRKSDGTIEIVCGGGHLDGFMRYEELADVIEKWLEKTGR